MSKQVCLTVPDEVMRRAEVLAGHFGRAVTEVLTDAIEAALDPLNLSSNVVGAMGDLPDAQVVQFAEGTMASAEDQRLSSLLDRRQTGVITLDERTELASLMQIYQEGLLRKAQGLSEAVRRGLRPPPAP